MTTFMRLRRHHVEDSIRDLLGKELTERVRATRLDSDLNDSILGGIGAHALRRYLPGEVLNAIEVFAATGNHVLLLANLPTQELPPTPVTGFGDEAELAVVNALHLGLIRLLGCTPFAVNYENDGRLLRNVVPNPKASGMASSWGSDSEFFWHSDNPNQPFGAPGSDPRCYVPHYLTFVALRNEERVPTEVMAIEDAVIRLDRDTLSQLQVPAFEVGAPDSNDSAMTNPLRDVPIIEPAPEGHYRVRYDRGTTRGRTETAAYELDRWSEVLRQTPAEELVLEPGMFMVFDNYRVLHRRAAFHPNPDDTARWLRRCYAA